MTKEISTTDSAGFALPSYIKEASTELTDNMAVADSTPKLTISGKVWKVVVGGVEKPLLKKDEDGEEIPAPTVRVIILNQLANRSRTYYEGTYVPGVNTAPTCHSIDGIKPDESVAEPQSPSCSTCEWAVKGSKITEDGKAVAACSTNKRICVVPAASPDFSALLLKLPVTSLWEEKGEEEAKGWFAYDAYIKFLKGNNVTNTIMVETLMKFDSKVDHPKILFKHAGFPSQEVFQKLVKRGETEEVKSVLGLVSAPVTQAITNNPENKEENINNEEDASKERKKVEEAEAKKKAAEKRAATLRAKKEKEAAEKAKAEEEAKKAEESPVTIIEEDDDLAAALENW